MSDTKMPKVGSNHPRTWRSLDELAGSPEYQKHVEQEFPDLAEAITDSVSRRKFMGLMGATVALSGLVGCRRPLVKILPYARMPEEILPGVPVEYASVHPFQGIGHPVVVEAHEGRPVKLEGNASHPASGGATSLHTQASILDLYDPERIKVPQENGHESSWTAFETWAASRTGQLRTRGGRGLRILAQSLDSPSLAAMRSELEAAYPEAVWHTYEPWNRDQVVLGSLIAFKRPLRTQLALEQADVVLALDSDFLFNQPDSVRNARAFAGRRKLRDTKDMNRLYAVEPTYTVTGSMADNRLRLEHSRIATFARGVAAGIAAQVGSSMPITAATGLSDEETRWVAAVAKDLASHRGRAVVVVGSGQPAVVHALAHAMNEMLGSVGTVVRYTEEPTAAEQTRSLVDLVDAMQRGTVDTLIVLGGNPVFDAPANLDFAARLESVPNRVYLGLAPNETSEKCGWVLPGTHYLEAWGDARSWDGTLSIQQPLIAPLYEGRSELELLALLAGRSEREGHAIVLETHRLLGGNADFDARWRRSVHDGLVAGSAYPEVPASVDAAAVGRAVGGQDAPRATAQGFEVVFRPDNSVYDGRFTGNGWMQELPDNITKLTWDNAAILSPKAARELGVATEDLVTLNFGDRSLTLVAYVLPGQAEYVITLPLGYGRTVAGEVGTGTGFNVYTVRTTTTLHAATGVTVAKAGGTYKLATTQDHHATEFRALAREADLDHYREHPDFPQHMEEHPPLKDIYIDREWQLTEGYQWGMSIDLTTCIGCNACSIACQSENNIAIVGKEQVGRGREMHWIRIDRYFSGEDEDNPSVASQPVPCMQCENAPCESVCPVAATVHSDEGLNDMVYNRCIGTRYCNNNCPYKVRRFNYFDWNDKMPESEKMAKNPDVTVRMRGVMEKCTYCTQRISRAKITAKNDGRTVRDGEIQTACQQVCPTGSIVFGNINDAESEVAKLKAEDRNYAMLAFLNTRPRTTYLAKVRNPNHELEAV